MKKIIASLALVVGLVLTPAVAYAAPAGLVQATPSSEVCTPKDAWTETIDVPAVGSPTIEVRHEEVPAQGTETITVDNPDYKAATEAVAHTEWKYVKHGGNGEVWVNNDTFKYVTATGHGTNEKPKHENYYNRTQNTREVIDVEGTPAVGEPTKTIPNPDYVPAVEGYTTTETNPEYVPATTRTVEHEAVVCPEVPGVNSWTPTISASCDSLTFSHPKFKVSTDPVYTVQHLGAGGVVLSTVVSEVAYTWGESVTVVLPTAESDNRYRLIIRAKNPSLGGAYQQLGTKDVWTTCIPTKPEVLTDDEYRDSEPVCTEPRDGTQTQVSEARTWEQDWEFNKETGKWEATDRVYSDWVQTIEVTDNPSCAPVTPPETIKFETLLESTCESISFWHSEYQREDLEVAEYYEFEVTGDVTESGEYTFNGIPFSIDAPNNSKSYLTIEAVFEDGERVTIIEHVFDIHECGSSTTPPTDEPPTTPTDEPKELPTSPTDEPKELPWPHMGNDIVYTQPTVQVVSRIVPVVETIHTPQKLAETGADMSTFMVVTGAALLALAGSALAISRSLQRGRHRG